MKNKKRIYNVEAAAAAPNNPYCPNEGYKLPKSCKPPVAAKCKVLCDQIGPEITELNKQCGIERRFRTELAALLLNKNDLTLGNLIQTYIDAKGPNKVDKALEAIRKYLNSDTVKGNKSVNLWNLALWNLANAKGKGNDGKGGKNNDGKGDGKKNGKGKGPGDPDQKKDKNDKNNHKDKADKDTKAKNGKNQKKDKADKDTKAKNGKNQKKDKADKESKAKNNPNSNSGVAINEKAIIALIQERRRDNKLLEDAKNKVKATEDKLRDAGCITTTTTPAPTTTPPPTSLAPQTKIPNGKRDIWFLNPSAKNRRHKKQKAQIKK